jgi:hypothetical protein
MDISELSVWFSNSVSSFDTDVKKKLASYVTDAKKSLEELSPVDSGEYKGSWESQSSGYSGTISNDKIQGKSIEFGSRPGNKPWPNVGKKTILTNGRIFSNQAPVGTISKVFDEKNVKNFAELIGDSIEVFK